ncbi:MAG: S49 family peptidase [Salinirussus sp.]
MVLIAVLGVGVGALLAIFVWTVALGSSGTVAVVPVDGTIAGPVAEDYSQQLRHARQNPSIEAVVIVSNSGGGGASSAEEMYFETKRTAREMPVVASVDAAAASGAYYAIAPADRIVAKPASRVGSIGVVARVPPDVEPNDLFGTTGPSKLIGLNDREFFHALDAVQNAFLSAVMEHRGDELTVSRAEISSGRTYPGLMGVDIGLVDGVGGTETAIRDAARMAGLENYDVTVLRSNTTARFVSQNNYLSSTAPRKATVSAERLLGNGSAPVYLMMPESYLADAIDDDRLLQGATVANRTGNATTGVTG